MKKYYLFYLAFIIYLTSTLTQEAYAFSIDPGRIELSISAGKQKGKTVTIDNSHSDEPLHLKVYVQDVIYLPDGTNDFPAPGTTQWSCANWVKVVPQEVDIPAGKTQTVRVSLLVPEEAKGGYYGMLFFESSPTYNEGLGINFRLGALLDITASGTEVRKAQLADISLTNSKQIEVAVFNEGNVLVRPKGKIKILNAQGKKIGQLEFNPQRLSVLPKSLRKFYSKLDESLAAGKYRLKAEIDYGTKYILVGELPVTIE